MYKILKAPVTIAGGARTPIGRFNGILGKRSAVELGTAAIEAAVERSQVDPAAVELVVMGNVVSAGLGQGPAKQASDAAGLSKTTVCRSMNSVCGSALAAIADCANAIELGMASVAVAGGMESCSTSPYLIDAIKKDGSRFQCKLAGYKLIPMEPDLERKIKTREVQTKESTRYDGLYWPPDKKFMKEYAVIYASKMGIKAEEVDEAAGGSYMKARKATDEGRFKDEIVPVDGYDSDDLVPEDVQAQLREAGKGDPASAYNSSNPADGGAAIVMLSEEKARDLGIKPVGLIHGYSVVNCAAEDFLTAPVDAVRELRAALISAGRRFDPAIVEANEAFGLQIPIFEKEFAEMKVNVHGGAVALGHPLGASGCRLLVTLLNAMKQYGHRYGIVTMCFGSGGAYAVAVEVPE
ncbi:MAG: thiolase family protein [Firmicutes bacterium]|nr:thiolase family protein [Bacillota bacterium]